MTVTVDGAEKQATLTTKRAGFTYRKPILVVEGKVYGREDKGLTLVAATDEDRAALAKAGYHLLASAGA